MARVSLTALGGIFAEASGHRSSSVVSTTSQHPRRVIPAKAGTHLETCSDDQVGPSFAGMTTSWNRKPARLIPAPPTPCDYAVAPRRAVARDERRAGASRAGGVVHRRAAAMGWRPKMVRDVPFGSSLSPVSKSDLDHDRRGASLVFCFLLLILWVLLLLFRCGTAQHLILDVLQWCHSRVAELF